MQALQYKQFTSLRWIIVLFVILCQCTKPLQKSDTPQKPIMPNLHIASITLECVKKQTNTNPFIELSIIVRDETTVRYYIATVYGTLHEIYNLPPQFAPQDALCGVSIHNTNSIQYFFVCVPPTAETIVIKSTVNSNTEQQLSFHTVISIPDTVKLPVTSSVLIRDIEQ
ncbi:MAG: hypothetical protein ACUVRK_05105 [Spirochaetota bacterium]